MATRKQLRERWFEGAGGERLQALIAWLHAAGPQSTDELPALLDGLPPDRASHVEYVFTRAGRNVL